MYLHADIKMSFFMAFSINKLIAYKTYSRGAIMCLIFSAVLFVETIWAYKLNCCMKNNNSDWWRQLETNYYQNDGKDARLTFIPLPIPTWRVA